MTKPIIKSMQSLIDRIDAYCAATGYAPSYVSAMAVNDGSLYTRIKAGKAVTMPTYERVHAWLQRAEQDLASGVWVAKASYKGVTYVKPPRKPRPKR